jgi:hypothetical protein
MCVCMCAVLCCPVQMEDTTPPAPTTDSCRYSQAGVVPCDLPFLLDEDEFDENAFGMNGDEFGAHVDNPGPPGQSMCVPDMAMTDDDIPDAYQEEVHDETEVHPRTCYCQAPPSMLPLRYTPCCLSLGVLLATREIQMFPEFRNNLLLVGNAPAKTQTCRVWGAHRARQHKESFTEGKWIRVWRGQGHKDTIGWLLITHWDEVKVGDIDKGDCVREGRPEWEPAHFKKKYLRGMDDAATVIRIKFDFRPCRACITR